MISVDPNDIDVVLFKDKFPNFIKDATKLGYVAKEEEDMVILTKMCCLRVEALSDVHNSTDAGTVKLGAICDPDYDINLWSMRGAHGRSILL